MEARAFFIARLRRTLGVVVGREMARHRLRRVPFIGVPRAAVRAHIAARDRRRGQDAQPAMPDGVGVRPDDFYAFQVFGPAVQAVAVA